MPQAHPGHVQDLAWNTWTELCSLEHPGNATALMAGKEMWVLPLSSKGSEAIRWRSQTREQAHSLHVPLLCHSKEFKPWRFCLFLLFFLLAVIVRNDVNRYIVKYAPFALIYFFFFLLAPQTLQTQKYPLHTAQINFVILFTKHLSVALPIKIAGYVPKISRKKALTGPLSGSVQKQHWLRKHLQPLHLWPGSCINAILGLRRKSLYITA